MKTYLYTVDISIEANSEEEGKEKIASDFNLGHDEINFIEVLE